ncbi:hypothetical protein [Variovorax sp. J31P179]|uniref:hypothetical protein n=1 Tax=Variovorax sp. J31P179 TaxID=3053508 RepID=UPI002574E18D|nr:hypothetical protein [Variovorax sp. J31P179]
MIRLGGDGCSDLNSPAAAVGGAMRRLVEQVGGMPVVVGNEIQSDSLHAAIMEKICNAW